MRLPRWLRTAIVCVLLVACPSAGHAAFTEFYCNASTGSNTYAGSTEGSPVLTLTGGDWVSSTGVFTKTGAVTGVTTGMFAAVMVDGGTVAARIGRVTAVDANTVTISTTAGSGSLANQTATCTINVGGCWKGPDGSVDFPLDFITNAQTDSSGNHVRVNLKSNSTYSISASIVPNQAGPITVQGYTTTAGDGGRATIDGSTNAIVLLAPGTTADAWSYWDLIFSNNGSSGSNNGVTIQSGCLTNSFYRCKFTTLRGYGLSQIGGEADIVECEFTACNGSGSFATGGLYLLGTAIFVKRCYIHDNTASQSVGCYWLAGSNEIIDSIFDSNASDGVYLRGGAHAVFRGCDFYNNGGAGVLEYHDGNVPAGLFENCNFVKNAGYGANVNAGTVKMAGVMVNCGFGAGTQANGSGKYPAGVSTHWEMIGEVNYASNVTPWNDPANGDFTIVLGAAKGTGRGVFPGTSNTTGYPDIRAAQSRGGGAAPAGVGGGVVGRAQ